ncbi:MAG: hypothetical protein AB8G14_03130 [Ilumatobacter sp.]
MTTPTTTTLGTRMNAALSLVTGAVLTVAPGTISDRLGLDIGAWLRTLGIALLAHAAWLEWVTRRPQPAPWVRLNLALITPYPVAMLAIAASPVVGPTSGKAVLMVDGVCVTIVAVAQWRGLRQVAHTAATLPA